MAVSKIAIRLMALHESHCTEQRDLLLQADECEREIAFARRGNVAYGVARVPSIVVRILEVLWEHVEFKRWMSEQPSREFIKRRRDPRQADAVQQLLDERRLEP